MSIGISGSRRGHQIVTAITSGQNLIDRVVERERRLAGSAE
ncbi:hypothetical protein [Nocardia sp. NPDC051750]